MDIIIKRILILVGSIAAIFLLDYTCPIRTAYNFPCPGCGLTRAWFSFLNGNLSAAFSNHPLFWVIPILVLIFIFDDKIPPKYKKIIVSLSIILFILVYVYRIFTNTLI